MYFQHRADAIITFVSYRSQIYGGTDVAFKVYTIWQLSLK